MEESPLSIPSYHVGILLFFVSNIAQSMDAGREDFLDIFKMASPNSFSISIFKIEMDGNENFEMKLSVINCPKIRIKKILNSLRKVSRNL